MQQFTDAAQRAGLTTSERERLKQLERENRKLRRGRWAFDSERTRADAWVGAAYLRLPRQTGRHCLDVALSEMSKQREAVALLVQARQPAFSAGGGPGERGRAEDFDAAILRCRRLDPGKIDEAGAASAGRDRLAGVPIESLAATGRV